MKNLKIFSMLIITALLLHTSDNRALSFSWPRAITAVGSALRAAASRLPSISGSKKFLYGGLLASCTYGLYTCAKQGHLQNMTDIIRSNLGWPPAFDPKDRLSYCLQAGNAMLKPIECGTIDKDKDVVFNLIGFQDSAFRRTDGFPGTGEALCGGIISPMQQGNVSAIVYAYNAAFKKDIPGTSFNGETFTKRLIAHINHANKVIYFFPSAKRESMFSPVYAGDIAQMAYIEEQLQKNGCLRPEVADKSIIVLVNDTNLNIAENIQKNLKMKYPLLQNRVFCHAMMNRCPTGCPGDETASIMQWLSR